MKRTLSTPKMLKLFVASTLLLGATGCSGSQSNCVDQNNDGYCDNGSGSSSGGRAYFNSSGSSGKSGTSTGGISSGSHGGLGSSGSSSS
ncbi:hypothetical protein FPZ49_17070 [Paenibacillus cremeus]|uniref:Lipoprotein n=2 Tax=Paenibacillus cremeus TaxID=2163881 RepID=A0A559K9K8_9BACL|nr:hypothetical protein FPZ49_17070 [Paenibacillus cremeus]